MEIASNQFLQSLTDPHLDETPPEKHFKHSDPGGKISLDLRSKI